MLLYYREQKVFHTFRSGPRGEKRGFRRDRAASGGATGSRPALTRSTKKCTPGNPVVE
jgi:hypothetical protein